MRRNYDLVAPFYPALERAAFGIGLTEARHLSLLPVVSAERTLLIGEGNGRFLSTCVQEKVGGSITVVDSSERMLSLAGSRIRGCELRTELQLLHADFCEWSPDEPRFDVIVTHFFLDLFRPETQRRLIEKISALSTPDTVWMNVDFRPVIGSRLHRMVDWLQYRFDRLFSGIEADRHYDPAHIIKDFGWDVQDERSFCQGTVHSQTLTAPFLSAQGKEPD
jgi:ubiquinone/menaquinone biosynthesis C-methylase UbiE